MITPLNVLVRNLQDVIFPHGYVGSVLFTEHFAECYFPCGFTIFVFISLDNKGSPLHEGGESYGYNNPELANGGKPT